jgi:hypothetical protein
MNMTRIGALLALTSVGLHRGDLAAVWSKEGRAGARAVRHSDFQKISGPVPHIAALADIL